MLPIADDGGGPREAVACLTLMGLCLVVFLVQILAGPLGDLGTLAGAFTPGFLFGGAPVPPDLPLVPPPATLVSYQFLHAGWLHLLGNLLFLWVFGPRVEADLGPGPFTVFYLGCGIAAALGQAYMDPASPLPMVGASGATSGVLGAYLLLHPRAEIRLVVPVFVVLRVVSLPAFVVLLAWFGFQLAYDGLTPDSTPGIAFRAHVVGFMAGMVFTPFFAFGWLKSRMAVLRR